MKSKIFNTDQVRDIQKGRMTQFMQVVKPQPWVAEGAGFAWGKGHDNSSYKWNTDMQSLCSHMAQRSAFGKPGDVIYCRETWWSGYELNENDHIVEEVPLSYWYFADTKDARPGDMSDSKCYHLFGGDKSYWPAWRSPATMPREAARLFLHITNIRVMGVQELRSEDWEKQACDNTITIGHPYYNEWVENKYHWIIDFEKCEKPQQ